jgi:hypothetical protein
MAAFVYNDSQRIELSKIDLAPGQLSRPLVLRLPPPDPARVHSLILFNENGVMMSELMRMASYSPADPYRVFELVGARPGTWKVSAWDVPRTGPGVEIARLTVEVRKAQQSDPDLSYRGTYLTWLKSFPPGLGPEPLLFSATSGLPGSQIAREQSNKDHGPVPEGTYKFLARIDPLQSSVSDANKREATATRDGALSITNMDEGIQFLPVGGNGPVYSNWGTMRVRLAPVRGNMFSRSGFYLHNSHKGFSHGCIEVGSGPTSADFFSTLVLYALASTRSQAVLAFGVQYTYPDQTTLGDTLRSN